MNSFKDLEMIRKKENDKVNQDKKRKIRRVQTLNMKNQNPSIINKLSQKNETQKKMIIQLLSK